MSTNTLWSCDRLTRLHDIEDIVKRDLRETTGATNSLIGRLDDTNDTTKSYISRVDDMYPVATPVTQEQTMHFDDGDQTKTYTNLKCLRCPGSSFDGASNTLKTHDIDWNNNTLGTQPCTFNSIRSEMGSVYSTDLYSNLKETIVQQECDTVMNDAASNMSSTFSCTSPSVSEDSNSTDRTPGSPSSSYSSSSQCISNVPAYNISHSIYMCTAFQSNIKSIKTERCVHIPDNNLEMISTPFKIISHRLHSGGEVSSYVISNPKGDNSLIKNAVDTSSPMFKELLHSLSIAPGYDPRMTQSIWMSQVTLPEQEMTSPIAEVTSQQEASIMTSQTPATDNEEDDKAYQELRKSKTRKREFYKNI